MRRRFRNYPLTLFAFIVLDFSFIALGLVAAEVLPMVGPLRIIVVPAYMTVVVSAVLRTALPAVGSVAGRGTLFLGIALCLLPFFAVDRFVNWWRRRRRTAVAV
jgi:hypothetical protein